jgi:two-component system sensor histidine kinase TctE
MDRDSQIVIGPDGIVLAATADLPPGLVDRPLEECEGLSRQLRDAGKDLLQQLRRATGRIVTRDVTHDGETQPVQLIAIEALAIRRHGTDLRTLLRSKLAVLSSQALVAHVTLNVAVADDVPALVQIDSEKVAWAVTTLVGNAVRYVRTMPRRYPGGKVDVLASFNRATGDVTIEVQDDGPGIPADSVARLFKRDGLNVLGTGLALLVMADLCAAHGGKIDVRSTTDASSHGTIVRLTFPAE